MNPGPCALCGGDAYTVEWSLPIGTVLACRKCSLVRLVDTDTGDPVTVDYDEPYYRRDAAGATVGYPDYFGAEAEERRANAVVFARLVTFVAPDATSALDIGCGGGYLVDALDRCGVDATGVDGSAYAVEQARRLCSGRFEQMSLEDSAFALLRRRSVVTMMDVIEHLVDPVAAVRAAAALVEPGGVLIVLTPRYGGRLLEIQRADYVHFNTDHVLYFTADTLRATIERALISPDLVILDVLDLAGEYRIPLPRTFTAKYGRDRDSMIGVVRNPAVRDQT